MDSRSRIAMKRSQGTASEIRIWLSASLHNEDSSNEFSAINQSINTHSNQSTLIYNHLITLKLFILIQWYTHFLQGVSTHEHTLNIRKKKKF